MAGLDFNYTGNAGLGLSNPDIPVTASEPLATINQTGRDIMLLNHENNLKLYDQKIKDRNKQLELLDSGQVATGEILDKDRPEVKKYQDATDKEFKDFVKAGGINNPEAFRKYQGSIKNLKDAITHAQFRYVGRKQLEKERGDQTIDTYQKDYDKHIAEEDNKGFFEGSYNPYQHALTVDTDSINKLGVVTPFEFSSNEKGLADLKGTFKTNGTVFDAQQTQKNILSKYLENDKEASSIRGILSGVELLPPVQKKSAIDAMNAQIQKYNTDNNIDPSSPNLMQPVVVSASGKIADNPVDFATKFVLSHQPAFKTSKTALDPKAKELAIKEQAEKDKLKIEQGKLGLGYARLALDKIKFKDEMNLKWYESKQKLKTAEDKGVWINDQTTSLINDAKSGTKIDSGEFAGQYKTTSKALVDMFTNEVTNALGKKIKVKPVAIYVNDKNEATPVYKEKDKEVAGEKMSADELKSKIAETQFGKSAQAVLDASNQVLEKTVGTASLNDKVDDYYDYRNKGLIKKGVDKFPLPKGNAETVSQGGITYTWNPSTGKYE